MHRPPSAQGRVSSSSLKIAPLLPPLDEFDLSDSKSRLNIREKRTGSFPTTLGGHASDRPSDGWTEPAETNPKKAFEIDYEAFPAGSFYQPDPPRKGMLRLWDRIWLRIPRTLHFLVWYPIVIALMLMSVLLWQSGAKTLMDVKSTKLQLSFPLPVVKGEIFPFNEVPIFSDLNGNIMTNAPIKLKFDFGTMDPNGPGVKVGVKVTFDSYFDLVSYNKESIIQENLFFISDEAISNFTGLNWTQVDLYYLSWKMTGPVSINDTFEEDSISDFTIPLEMDNVSPFTSYPWDSYTGTFDAQIMLGVRGSYYNASTDSEVKSVSLGFPIPVDVEFAGSSGLPGYTCKFKSQAVQSTGKMNNVNTNITYISTSVTISRNVFVQGITLFVVVSMWLIATGTLISAFDYVLVRPSSIKQDDGTRASLCACILFALPSLRSVCAGIPPVELYAYIDVTSFYINMVQVAIALVIYIGHMTFAKKTN